MTVTIEKNLDGIVQDPADVLRMVAQPIGFFDSVSELAVRLRETLKEAQGLGLAAPQIGVSRRVIAVLVPMGDGTHAPFVMVNPVLLSVSETKTTDLEGCLSIPGVRYAVERPDKVEVQYSTPSGILCSLKASGITAKCIQHEIDHLDGILIKDKGILHVPEAVIDDQPAAEVNA